MDVIEGVMPNWRRYFHKSVAGFMSVLFGGMALISLWLMIRPAHTRADQMRFFVSFLMMLLAGAAIGSQVWFHRRIISEFRCDWSTLQFQTIGIQQPHMRPLADLTSIQDWRGKGGILGYCFQFRDRQKLYLEFSVSNSIVLANRLRADRKAQFT